MPRPTSSKLFRQTAAPAGRARVALVVVGLMIAAILNPLTTTATSAEPRSTDPSDWLVEKIEKQAEAGAKSVVEGILSTAAKSLLESYSPALASLIFGGGDDGLEAHTQRILDNMNDLHDNLSRSIDGVQDELQDQFETQLISTSRQMDIKFTDFLRKEDLLDRINNRRQICDVRDLFNDVRTDIEGYIGKKGNDSNIHYRRLQLLSLHITAAQMAVNADRFCEGLNDLELAFQRDPANPKLAVWVAALTPEQVDQYDNYDTFFRDSVYDEVISFYEGIAVDDGIRAYVEDYTTPLVGASETFQESHSLYRDPDSMNDRDAWARKSSGGGFCLTRCPDLEPILDGLRWYYYVDIPVKGGKECLEGKAYDDLKSTGYLPNVEVIGDYSGSPCNRSWVLSPNIYSSGWPNTYIASFDDYRLWYDKPVEDAYRLDIDLNHGKRVRNIYGPISLILDRMHEDLTFNQPRTNNKWDDTVDELDKNLARFGVAEDYTDAISYSQVREAEAILDGCGITVETVGLPSWFDALKRRVHGEAVCSSPLVALAAQAQAEAEADAARRATVVRETFYRLGDSVVQSIPSGTGLGINIDMSARGEADKELLMIDIRCDSTTPLRFEFAGTGQHWSPPRVGADCNFDPLPGKIAADSYRFEVYYDGPGEAAINLTTRFLAKPTTTAIHERVLLPQAEHRPEWTTKRKIHPGTAHSFSLTLPANEQLQLDLTCDDPFHVIIVSAEGELVVNKEFETCANRAETFTVPSTGQYELQLLPTNPRSAAQYTLGAMQR